MPPTAAEFITKRQRLELVAQTLRTERSSFETQWRDCADHICPTRPKFMGPSDRNNGSRKNQKIIDSTAVKCWNTLRAGLHAGMTNPARPWFKLGTQDPALAKFGPVKAWLHNVEQRLYSVLGLSNFYHAAPVTYGDMSTFATAAVGMLEDVDDLFAFYPYPIGSYYLGTDRRGKVCTFIRDYVMTVWQLVDEFGGPDGAALEPGQRPDWSRFSVAVKKLFDDGKYEAPIEVSWYVTPNREPDAGAYGARAYPFASCHYEKGNSDGRYLRESGFQEFPILAPRWAVNAEDIYGTQCPAFDTIGDIRQLQLMQKRTDQGVEKQLNPPMQASAELRTQKVSQLPGDTTFVSGFERGGMKPIYEMKPDVGAMERRIYGVQARINEGWYRDLFQMLSQMDDGGSLQPKTAREIEERHEEKLVLLGPVLDSTGREFLKPIIDRAFHIMWRRGEIPPPPPDVKGVELIPEFVSILAQARKMSAIGIHEGFVQSLMPFAGVDPTVLDVIDDIAYARVQGDSFGVDPSILRDDEAIAGIRQGRAKAQQAQAQSEQFAKMGAGAKALSATPMDGDTALTRLVGGLTQ